MTERDQLLELRVDNLGVIDQLGLVLGPGMTAITGETGAGKTLVLTAIQLLIGGRADAGMVGPLRDEAVVQGRFLHHGEEVVVERVVPRSGRSRAYVNGRLATAGSLAELGAQTVEVHGQNGHQALAAGASQRAALDRYGEVDIAPLVEVRVAQRALHDRLASLGGDERERLRQIELYRFQVDEISGANIVDANEDLTLQSKEKLLADAGALRMAAGQVAQLLGVDSATDDSLRKVLGLVEGHEPLAELATRTQQLLGELGDLAARARNMTDQFEDDPAGLEQLQERRRVLSDLRRKYGERLDDVLAYHHDMASRLQELEDHEVIAQELQIELDRLVEQEREIAAKVGAARRKAAPKLAKAVTRHVRQLALPDAQLEVQVGDDPGDHVTMLMSTNRGMPAQPLAKVASGGELARFMLATRMVLSADPATMVFDEVDAGVGGAAAQAVGRALQRLGESRQVLVVTHLPQVAACAHHQVQVQKTPKGDGVAVTAELLLDDARVIELSRMLSGSPDSDSAQQHAQELLLESVDKIRVPTGSRGYGETP